MNVGRGQNKLLLLVVFSQFSGNSSLTLKTHLTEATFKWSQSCHSKELPCEPDASRLQGCLPPLGGCTGQNNQQWHCVCQDSKAAALVTATLMAAGLKIKNIVQNYALLETLLGELLCTNDVIAFLPFHINTPCLCLLT